jgi:2'-5' RNA ligase
MKRIFIAVMIDQGETLMKMISSFKTGLKDEMIKWTGSENLHITLAFIGDTEEEKVKATGKMLQRVCEGSGGFEILLKGAGLFKNIRDPWIIWTGIEHSERLVTLFESVKHGLRGEGMTIEERDFSPHLTLGRIKSLRNADALQALISGYKDVVVQSQQVSEVILYESLLFHSGPVYKPLGKYCLDTR